MKILENFMSKKLLILGANPETIPLIKRVNERGLFSYVMGKEKYAPAMGIAKFSILGDASNIKLVKTIIKKYKIDGILLGTVDVLLPAYEQVCRELKLPCYANKKAVKYLSSKKNFSSLCRKFKFDQVSDYTSYIKNNKELPKKFFPVLIKPIDSGGGVGAKVCHSNSEITQAVKNALKKSKKKNFICQKYFLEDDIQLYYTIIRGKIYLSCVVDRTTNKNQENKSPVCIGANYKSKYLNLIIDKYNKKFQKMVNFLKLNNGVLSIQCFVKNKKLYPYDPGLRLQGEGQHLVLNKINGFNHLDMLINLSLGKTFFSGNFNKLNDPFLKNKFICSVWILLKKGVIKNVINLEKIKKHKCYLDVLQRFKINDKIKSEFLATEKQVFARIYLSSNKKKELINSINYIHKNLKILDKNGNNLILDKFKLL